MRVRTLPLLVALLVCLVSFGNYAQAQRTERLNGEDKQRVSVKFAGKRSSDETTTLSLNEKGLQLGLKQTTGKLVSKPISISLANPLHFISVASIWKGHDLHQNNVDIELRSSKDGITWSDWEHVDFDSHADDDATRRVSRMTQLDKTMRFVQFQVELKNVGQKPVISDVEFVFYSPGESLVPKATVEEHNHDAHGRMENTCPKPAVVSRSAWGARAPSGSRSYTTVTHLVVHHEAGSNTASDWVARVKSIESLHIDANGWSDIGYNYLIDPNGVIYEGRSGGDNVIGAHFCGGNSNTMAVCMMGNFMSVSPTTAAKESLKRLFAWKASQRGINPTGTAYHYAAGTIPTIPGHRDNGGCSSCPGNILYGELPAIRTAIKDYIAAGCGGGTVTDATAPTTSISAPSTTVGADFTATFNDADNVGVTERFYQVLEFGTEWRANRGNGFFNDNFNGPAIHPDWTVHTGTWAITTEKRLNQSNATLTNTNIATAFTQGSGQAYLYHFAAKLNSAATTAGTGRFGLHIFSDNVSMQERNNSYLIWVTPDESKIRIYETVANVLYSRAEAALTTTTGNWGDFKVTYNASTGVINVYVNDVRRITWTDTTPLTSGSGISLRTNQANVEFEDFKIYKSRSTSKVITVGPELFKDARKESPNTTTAACKVKSVVRDAAHNWSDVGNLDLIVDFPSTARMEDMATALRVFPNPIDDVATIAYTLSSDSDVSIAAYDLQGKLLVTLVEGAQQKGEHLIPAEKLAALKPGMYLIRLQSEAGSSVIKVLKN